MLVMHRLLPLLTIAFLGLCATASAQLVVYKLDFEATGESINYRSYQSGYYIAPMTGGTGSLVLMLTTGGVKQYFTYENFGELFVALSGSDRKVVFSATAANTVSTTTFYAIGNATRQVNVETRSAVSQIYIAPKLSGYSVSADSERDLPFSSAGTSDVGVAGAAFLNANYDEGRTTLANNEARTLAEEVTSVEEFLTSKGYIDGLAIDNGSGGGGGGGTGGTGGAGTGGGGGGAPTRP
jgi:uncharacterized membrane protein YgcG